MQEVSESPPRTVVQEPCTSGLAEWIMCGEMIEISRAAQQRIPSKHFGELLKTRLGLRRTQSLYPKPASLALLFTERDDAQVT
jgi:hypothetical protein